MAAAAQSQSAFDRSYQFLESLRPPGPKPVKKPVAKIRPADLASGPYLETEEQVNDFVDGLRASLQEQIRSGKRVQIQ